LTINKIEIIDENFYNRKKADRKMKKIKVISFDMDGTLVDYEFVNSVWFEGIPKLYAQKENISFEDAREYVKKEYNKVGEERMEWYNIQYWLKNFGLNDSWKDILTSFRHKARVYPEVPEILADLNGKYDLIISSNSPREFLDIELEETKIRDYFKCIFSTTSDFKQIKKTIDVYNKICNKIKISPQEIIHVGDNWNFDFTIPKKLGITSYYLDRSKQKKGKFIIHDLKEFEKKLIISLM
jgi:putative hydrolase of the HAD superfamily